MIFIIMEMLFLTAQELLSLTRFTCLTVTVFLQWLNEQKPLVSKEI